MTDKTEPKRYRKPGPVAVAEAALRHAKREDSLGRSVELGLAFKALVGMTGLSYPEAADVLGLTLNQVKARATGRQAIARSELVALLEIYGVVENPSAEGLAGLPASARDRAAGAMVIRKFRDSDPSFPVVELPEFLRPDPAGETD